ncbi:MAG: HEAT repeat domain-containing protein [Candidatus Eisenbacteria sp.]|nr:HEAT repeat domain-containing protein [Candidatus Eisenbacteria bacterium]
MDEQILEQTQQRPETQAFEAFMSALKAVAFYPQGNPIRERMVETLHQNLAACITEPEGVQLSLRTEDVFLGETSVLTRGGDGWDMIVRLFESGLRNLTFLPGLICEELQMLLHLLARTVRGELNPTDEDLSVLLWEMDLPAVAYRVTEAAEEQLPVSLGDAVSQEEVSEDPELWEGLHPLERYVAAAGGLEETDLDARTFQVDEEELACLRNSAKQEGRQLRPKLLVVLVEMIMLDMPAVEFGRVLTLLRGYTLDLLQQGRFKIFGWVIRRLGEHVGALGVDCGVKVTEVAKELVGVEAAQRALGALESGRCDDEQDALLFLSQLDPPGLVLLLRASAEERVENGGADCSEIVVKALAQVATRRPEALLDHIEILTEEHLRLLAGILPNPLPPEQAEYWDNRLSPLFTNGDPGIRAGLLRFLFVLRPPDLERRLLYALDDEDSGVRQTAAELLGAGFGERALQPLLQVLLGPGFEKRDIEEQSVFYEALARSSPEEVFPLLEKTICRRSWLAPQHRRVQKICALRALGLISIEKAGPLLMKYRNSHDHLLAEASREALDRHRRRVQGTSGRGRSAA